MRTSERPSWQEIYGGRLPTDMPPVPRNDTPYVAQPQCPQDCTGRHGVDAEIRCAHCNVVAYVDWWHEYKVNRGVNFHQLQALNGATLPLTADAPCPVCRARFRK